MLKSRADALALITLRHACNSANLVFSDIGRRNASGTRTVVFGLSRALVNAIVDSRH